MQGPVTVSPHRWLLLDRQPLLTALDRTGTEGYAQLTSLPEVAMKALVSFLLVVACFLPAWGQDPCQVIFAVAWQDWDNPEILRWTKLTESQYEWWQKKGQKEFSGLCLTGRLIEAEYAIAFREWLGEGGTPGTSR